MLANYLPVLIFLVVAALLAGVLLGLGSGLGRYLSRDPLMIRRSSHRTNAALMPSKTRA